MGLALVLAGPVLLLRRGRHYLPTLRGRLGRGVDGPAARPGGLWIHAVSVGEVGVAATLSRALPNDQPHLVTTVTPTGQERARAAFRDRSAVAYLPFDLAGPVRRLFRRHQPEALVLVEGDYWPLILREAARRGLPVAVVNGRIGDRSFRRMARLRDLPGPFGRLGRRLLAVLFGPVHRFGVQTEEDRRRLIALGVVPERVEVTGNLKYDTPMPALRPELETALSALAGGRPLLVAGSTMAGEEARVLEAFSRLGGGERALLVLAPRHPERWDAVAAEVTGAGFTLVRRSALTPATTAPAASTSRAAASTSGTAASTSAAASSGTATSTSTATRSDIVLLDSLGELAGLYQIAAAAFIGGTLVPTGGHNPLEAACWGTPVAVGPSMENFRQIAEEFDRQESWQRVADERELAETWGRWLTQPDDARATGARGKALIEANRGALERTAALLAGWTAPGTPAAPAGRPAEGTGRDRGE